MLQRQETVTAAEVATELEISVRTARRDLEALAVSGVPVYSRHGRGGGWSLIGGATTDLTGLSQQEARALFLAISSRDDQNPNLRSALRKLGAALPETFRDDADAATTAIKVDASGWGQLQSAEPAPFLDLFSQAVIDGRQVRIDYHSRTSGRSERAVHPLGLVTKRNVWYLVANTDHGVRTFRLSRVENATMLDGSVDRPSDFDLDAAWQDVVAEVETQRLHIMATVDVKPEVIQAVRYVFGAQLREVETRTDGTHRVEISDYSARSFSAQIAGFGSAVEIVDPPSEVVAELRRIATELLGRYGSEELD